MTFWVRTENPAAVPVGNVIECALSLDCTPEEAEKAVHENVAFGPGFKVTPIPSGKFCCERRAEESEPEQPAEDLNFIPVELVDPKMKL